MFEKFNKKKWSVTPPKGTKYVKIGEIEKKAHRVRAFYLNKKSEYGLQYSAYLDDTGVMINVPKHLTDLIEKIISDETLVNAINDGHCGVKPYEYEKGGKIYTSLEFVDI